MAKLSEIRIPFIPDYIKHNAHMFYVITKSFKQRTELIKFLNSKNISSVFHYVPLHDSPAGKVFSRSSGNLEITNIISDTLLRLPLFYDLSEIEVNKIIKALKEFISNDIETKKESPL